MSNAFYFWRFGSGCSLDSHFATARNELTNLGQRPQCVAVRFQKTKLRYSHEETLQRGGKERCNADHPAGFSEKNRFIKILRKPHFVMDLLLFTELCLSGFGRRTPLRVSFQRFNEQ